MKFEITHYHCWRWHRFNGAEVRSLHKAPEPYKTRAAAKKVMDITPNIHTILPCEDYHCPHYGK